MKKKTKVILSIAIILCVAIFCGIGYFIISLTGSSKNEESVILVIEPGTPTISIIENLKEEKLIRSELALKIYIKLNNITLQAGTYKFEPKTKTMDIIKIIRDGNVLNENNTISFIEGKRVKQYVSQISSAFGYSEKEIFDTISDKTYLKTLIEKYWFLTTEILNDNIYYALEGYLFPDTYQFNQDATIKEIIEKMLNVTSKRLEVYKTEINESNYTVHEILSMASIIELEANSSTDRMSVSQVIYKRLKFNMSLGMDVTTYYAVQKEMGETLYQSDLYTKNAYNTRDDANMAGKLPIGPICNPSIDSIHAVFNPTNTDYVYFYADIATGKVYFAKTYAEFLKIQEEVG